MYIKIQNNILTDYADWNFEGSRFVDIDYNSFVNNRDKYEIKDGEIVDISDTEDYKNKKRLKEIDAELEEIDELYYAESQKPFVFEGHQYKFEWTSLYQNILESGILPAKIWDMTELEENAVVMDKEKLHTLQTQLLNIEETAFQTKKEARSLLLLEKKEIEDKLKG